MTFNSIHWTVQIHQPPLEILIYSDFCSLFWVNKAEMKPLGFSSTSNNPKLSELPANVIGLILTFLPIKEAARTSILSTQWRRRWRTIPKLVFDNSFATIHIRKLIGDSDSDFDSDSDCDFDYYSRSELEKTNKVMSEVYQALLGHEGSSINKFELAIPGMRYSPQLPQLIRYLSTKHVNELSLIFFPDPDELLPSSIFSLTDLVSLKLQGFNFVQLPCFVGFSKLTILDLEDVTLPNSFYDHFLPLCPLLEELRIVDYNPYEKKPVFAAPSLRLLFFLSDFEYICFELTPRLSVLTILDAGRACFENHDPVMVALFAGLPGLEELNIGIRLLKFLSVGHVPYQLPASLHNLKVVKVSSLLLGSVPEVQVLLCLIRSSPNLQKLTIVQYDLDSNPIHSLQKLFEPGDQLEVCCLQKLEELNIEISLGTRVEMDWVRFVLATASELKRVFIKLWNDDNIMKYVAEVAKYKRISKVAEVKFVTK